MRPALGIGRGLTPVFMWRGMPASNLAILFEWFAARRPRENEPEASVTATRRAASDGNTVLRTIVEAPVKS